MIKKSILFLSFNRKKYLHESLISSFNQIGKNIEIIISDDCSDDGSFQEIEKLVKAYKGPHVIVLNRNSKTLGVVGNLNKAVSLASGELLIQMGDDDISLPNRVERSYEEWCASGKTAHSIFFNAQLIDEEGRSFEKKFASSFESQNKNNFSVTMYNGCKMLTRPFESGISPYNNVVLGATHAFSNQTFAIFGPLKEGIVIEDRAIPFRSLLLGEVRFVDEVLVFYRRHSGNAYPDQAPTHREAIHRQKETQNIIFNHLQAIQDLNKAIEIGLVDREIAKKTQNNCRREVVQKGLNRAVYSDHPFTELWHFLRGDLFEGNPAFYYRELFLITLKKGLQLKGFHLFRKLFGAAASDEPNKKIVKAQKASPAPNRQTK